MSREDHSWVADIDINLIYHINIELQAVESVVEEKSHVFWEHVIKGPNLFPGFAQFPLGRMAFDLRSKEWVGINWERNSCLFITMHCSHQVSLCLWNASVFLFSILILDHCNSHLRPSPSISFHVSARMFLSNTNLTGCFLLLLA